MASLLRMPAPAAGVQQALLLEWSVEEKESFSTSDVLAVIETDKAVIEIEAETDGTLHHRLVPAGTQVDVGTPIAVIGSGSDTADDIAALLAQAGDSDRRAESSSEPASSSKRPEPGSDGRDESVTPAASVTANGAAGSSRLFASPIARRMAREAGLMLADLTGWLTVVTVIAPIVLFMVGAGMASPFALSGAVSVNPHAIGAASGLYGFTQMAYGALCTVVVETWHPGSVFTVAVVLLASALLGQAALSLAVRR